MNSRWHGKKMTLNKLPVVAVLGLGMVLSIGVSAQDKTEPEVGKKSASPSVSGAEVKADQKFLMMAAQGNLAEIQMAQMAKQKTRNNEIINYANRIIEDHTAANDQVKQIASKKGLTLPKTPPADAQKSMKRMKGMTGAKFERAYVLDQVKDHQKDITEYQNEASHGYDDDIKTYATSTIPTLQKHLELAQALNNPVGKGSNAPIGRTSGAQR